MVDISVLDSIPEINILEEESISLESMKNELVTDYESKYQELFDEELILYPADERRILLEIVAGKLFQMAEIMNDRFQQNFIKYMYDENLKNWAANFGFFENGIQSASVQLCFKLSEIQDSDVLIPAGTRVTAGDNVFFATNEDAQIKAGQNSIELTATCTEPGTVGNNYTIGKLNILADPINYVNEVENVTESSGGHDEYSNDELKEKVLNFPNTYSTAGPEGCYEELTKNYSSRIVDAKIIADKQAAVKIYIMLDSLEIPDAEYCQQVLEYFNESKNYPDTDKIQILQPEKVSYTLNLRYYLNDDQKNIKDSIDETMKEVAHTFALHIGSKIGRAINPNLLISYALSAGASRVDLGGLEYTSLSENQIAICDSVVVEFAGFEVE